MPADLARSSLLAQGVWCRIQSGRAIRTAASLAFTSLLALVPLLTVTFYVLALFPAFSDWTSVLEGFVYSNLMPAAGDQVSAYLYDFADQAHSLPTLGLTGLLVSVLFLLSTIEDAFNDIWRVRKGRSLGRRLAVYLTMIGVGPVIAVIVFWAAYHLLYLPQGQAIPAASYAYGQLFTGFSGLIEFGGFAVLYRVLPNCSIPYRPVIIGALISTVLLEVMKRVFAWYVSSFELYQVIYGALWTIPVFFIWVLFFWYVTLFGACVTAQLSVGKQAEEAGVDKPNGR